MDLSLTYLIAFTIMMFNICFFVGCCIYVLYDRNRIRNRPIEKFGSDYYMLNKNKVQNYTHRHLRIPWVTFKSRKLSDTSGYIIIDRFFIRFGRYGVLGNWSSIPSLEVEDPFRNWSAGLSVGKRNTHHKRIPLMHRNKDGGIRTRYKGMKGHYYYIIWGLLADDYDVNDNSIGRNAETLDNANENWAKMDNKQLTEVDKKT